MAQFFIHLGATPALSAAELVAVYPELHAEVSGTHWMITDLPKVPDIDRLGGTVRVAELLTPRPIARGEIERLITDVLMRIEQGRKIQFGISLLAGELPLRQLGMQIKAALVARGYSARYSGGGTRELATIQVRQEGIQEFLISTDAGGWRVARTVAVQDPRAYVFRDTHKPARNLRRGMLPPKLAQILLNLANAPKGTITLDPFCGTGTVLIEGLTQGREVRGSDIDHQAGEEARTNLQWMGHILNEELPPDWIRVEDAAAFTAENVGGIATEGTLGPLIEKEANFAWTEQVFHELSALYKRFFAHAARALPAGGQIAMTLPAYHLSNGMRLMPEAEFLQTLPASLTLRPLLPQRLSMRFLPTLTPRGGLVVDRPDQMVGREMILLRKAQPEAEAA